MTKSRIPFRTQGLPSDKFAIRNRGDSGDGSRRKSFDDVRWIRGYIAERNEKIETSELLHVFVRSLRVSFVSFRFFRLLPDDCWQDCRNCALLVPACRGCFMFLSVVFLSHAFLSESPQPFQNPEI
jgi:hypothetical protein